MIGIPGDLGKDLCDAHLPMSRRDVLKVGGSGMLGLTLGSMLELKANESAKGGPGWGKAKSIIMIYLQGGPSHLDLWDPKPDSPDNVRSISSRSRPRFPE
tara:strand:+ start:166 stop:465 length:300 start_codon:yes stop_codon:yes gene_type:complete